MVNSTAETEFNKETSREVEEWWEYFQNHDSLTVSLWQWEVRNFGQDWRVYGLCCLLLLLKQTITLHTLSYPNRAEALQQCLLWFAMMQLCIMYCSSDRGRNRWARKEVQMLIPEKGNQLIRVGCLIRWLLSRKHYSCWLMGGQSKLQCFTTCLTCTTGNKVYIQSKANHISKVPSLLLKLHF